MTAIISLLVTIFSFIILNILLLPALKSNPQLIPVDVAFIYGALAKLFIGLSYLIPAILVYRIYTVEQKQQLISQAMTFISHLLLTVVLWGVFSIPFLAVLHFSGLLGDFPPLSFSVFPLTSIMSSNVSIPSMVFYNLYLILKSILFLFLIMLGTHLAVEYRKAQQDRLRVKYLGIVVMMGISHEIYLLFLLPLSKSIASGTAFLLVLSQIAVNATWFILILAMVMVYLRLLGIKNCHQLLVDRFSQVIVATSIAAILFVSDLIISYGFGNELRQPGAFVLLILLSVLLVSVFQAGVILSASLIAIYRRWGVAEEHTPANSDTDQEQVINQVAE